MPQSVKAYNNIDNLANLVQKPARYTGGELGSITKDKSNVDIRFAFCFPDVYEVGMSHLGMKLLYGLYNSKPNIWCERVFLPEQDMEQLMRENHIKLWGLESREPIINFDFIGFTLQYELSFTAVLSMLDLAGLELRSANRKNTDPIVIAGGPCACNPEPIADFIDLFVIGEGEEVSLELFELYQRHKNNDKPFDKQVFLQQAALIQGIYVPSFYTFSYNNDGTIADVTVACGAPKIIQKRIIKDMNSVYYPDSFVVPFVDIVHDRAISEIFRGCIRGCRFCQAGYIYRPVREKSPDTINKQTQVLCENTGYEEFSLSSLSTSDYTQLDELLPKLLDWAETQQTNISLPSLRIDGFPQELVDRINVMRRSGLTFAPEAGTQRLRDVINKNLKKHDILDTSSKAFESGWDQVKLYFMVGLPTETMDDIKGIATLGQEIVDCFYQMPNRSKRKHVRVNLSVACFVPKPFTPFQWESQDTLEQLEQKQQVLKQSLTTKRINLNWHQAHTSIMEGVLARGDRRLCDVVEQIYLQGQGRDASSQHFDFNLWNDIIEQNNLSVDFYTHRKRSFDEILPWDHIFCGVSKEFLIRENKRAHNVKTTPHCRQACSKCGVHDLLDEGEVCIGGI